MTTEETKLHHSTTSRIFPPVHQLKVRAVFLYKSYFSDFFARQRLKVRDKIIWTIWLIEHLPHVPEEYLKHLTDTDGLYEIRIQQGSDIFRIFCFFDEGNLVVLANGFQKKAQRTPKTEIDRALRIKKQYEQEKQAEEH